IPTESERTMRRLVTLFVTLLVLPIPRLAAAPDAPAFRLNDREYFEAPGASVQVFQDFYPEGHQGGVTVVQRDVRLAANGDVRLFGRTWYVDGASGIFPRQPGGPSGDGSGPAPLARGRRLSVAPEADALRMTIESRAGELALYDGRTNHVNGWFVVRSTIAAG